MRPIVTRYGVPVTHEPTQPEWLEAQQRLATLSSNGRLIVAEKSGHMIQFDQPQIVVDAIEAILDEARRTRTEGACSRR
jgi:pimeloyl-ACP methyl ester carboxylesterase